MPGHIAFYLWRLILRKLHIKGRFSHVYGHQDNDTDFEKLPLDAQLNVEADALAEDYYSDTVQSKPVTHVLPACPAMLVLNGITVSNNYKKHLIRAYTEPMYISYLRDKFNWSDALIQLIAWKSLSCGIRRVQRNCLVTKICNDLLPTAVTLRKWNYQQNDSCCLCGALETREHLIICKDPSRTKWKIQYMTAARKRLQQLGTKPGLIDVLCSTITDWFDTQNVTTKKYSKQYHRAIVSQSNIGWRQIFMGKLSQEWEKLQGPTKTAQGKTRPAYLWGASLVEISLNYMILLWEQRNRDVHGSTKEEENHRNYLNFNQQLACAKIIFSTI